MNDEMPAKAERRRERLICTNPLTGSEVGDVPIMSRSEVGGLVRAVRAAQAEWSRRSLRQRAQALTALRRTLCESADAVAEVIRGETGKVAGEALFEVAIACDHLDYLARKAPSLLLSRQASSGWLTHRRARVAYEPYGVIGAITPWNFPVTILSMNFPIRGITMWYCTCMIFSWTPCLIL